MFFADADEYFVGQSQVWQVGRTHKYRCHSVTSKGRKTLHLIKKDFFCNDCDFFQKSLLKDKKQSKNKVSRDLYWT